MKLTKQIAVALLLLNGTAFFAQEITDFINAKKNEQGEYVNKYPNGFNGYLKFSENLKPGYYGVTGRIADKFPTLIWARNGMTGGYNHYRTSETPQLLQYYFKQVDPAKGYFGITSAAPKGNQDPVDFTAKDLKLTSFGDVPPANIFPDFKTALKETPDGKNFIYCFYDHKSTTITKTTQDGEPVMSIEGNAEKLYQSVGCTVGFPLINSGKLTIKFTAKSAGGAKQMFVLVRDTFWKKGAAQKNFTLTNEWADYTFEVDCAKSMKEGIVLGSADCRFGQGVYLFKDFSITWTK